MSHPPKGQALLSANTGKTIDRNHQRAFRRGKPLYLTAAELRLLECFLSRPDPRFTEPPTNPVAFIRTNYLPGEPHCAEAVKGHQRRQGDQPLLVLALFHFSGNCR
jgi:hypothetical protein